MFFLYQYTNIDDRLILVLIGISIVYLTYILKFKKIKSYTPRLIATLFIILSFFPQYMNINNVFLFYLILIVSLIGTEYYYNVIKFNKN